MRILYDFVIIFFNVLSLAILARVLVLWFNLSPYHPIVTLLREVTEPILAPLRRVVPSVGMVDISPIIALILLQIIEQILIAVIRGRL